MVPFSMDQWSEQEPCMLATGSSCTERSKYASYNQTLVSMLSTSGTSAQEDLPSKRRERTSQFSSVDNYPRKNRAGMLTGDGDDIITELTELPWTRLLKLQIFSNGHIIICVCVGCEHIVHILHQPLARSPTPSVGNRYVGFLFQ